MKTLYESILSSTKSGRHIPLTDDYLYSKGAVSADNKCKTFILNISKLTNSKFIKYRNEKLVYKTKAGRYFCMLYGVDGTYEVWINTEEELNNIIKLWGLYHEYNMTKNDKLKSKAEELVDYLVKNLEIKDKA